MSTTLPETRVNAASYRLDGPGPQPGNPGVIFVHCVHTVQNGRESGRIGRPQVIRWPTYEVLPGRGADKLLTLEGAHPTPDVVHGG